MSDDLKYVPVFQDSGSRETPPIGSVQYEEILEELGKDKDEVLDDNFDYTDYLASTGQIVFAEDDPRADKYADNENYQAAANSQVAKDILESEARRDKDKEAAIEVQREKDKDLKYVPVFQDSGSRETPPEGSVQYEEILEELGKDKDEVLDDNFDYTDYLASTGQIVFQIMIHELKSMPMMKIIKLHLIA